MKTSVPIAFQAGAWNSSEIAAMTAAADYWNKFFAWSMGYPAIDYLDKNGNVRMSALAHPDAGTFCQEPMMIDPTTFNFLPDNPTTPQSPNAVVIYKDGSWGSTPAVIAYTTTCRPTKAPSPHQLFYFSNIYMEVNYQYFFVGGQRVPDLQSIVLHEFGHVMGINHTCEFGSTQSGVPDCSEPDLPPLYGAASMFPTFSFDTNGNGLLRQNLNANDEARMNCVYKYF